MQIGCFLSCEEFGPRDLVEQAKRAEQAGFHALWISDRYEDRDERAQEGDIDGRSSMSKKQLVDALGKR